MVDIAVGLGVAFSLIFNEIFGVSAGGIVVPGYVALQLNNGWMLAGTLLVSFATLLFVKIFANFVFIYGRRRLVLSILLGFIFGYILRNYVAGGLYMVTDIRLEAIGYIIPGLIANWMERQGVLRTLSAVTIAAVVVRLSVMIISGGQLFA
ncbi:MAG: poly-gamma-glutamate biosynthesis protein PgsC [Candidatus Electryonea clarkiae]|nr:poly-gamma-glutamate biosynthesis protein PgsC [Candidatus Electryonea clarkiae]MDP8288004.1 poly-gamma-glutamate biosynthesis protein PgsC [Candidatus Electryonea clarkiae]